MITFETRWNEETDRWQFKGPKGVWSEPLRLAGLIVAMKKEVEPVEPMTPYSRPVAHAPKRKRGLYEDTIQRYEIKGGKVNRIPATRTEKDNQDLAELMSLLDDEGGE